MFLILDTGCWILDAGYWMLACPGRRSGLERSGNPDAVGNAGLPRPSVGDTGYSILDAGLRET